MQQILNTVEVVSMSPVNVLIIGESGTGKELIAKMIHNNSKRNENALVSVNCAAIPDNLMESEFFGYNRGAFTGATSDRKGLFEEAHNGTLFLDEVADMPMMIQPKFLRVIQEGEGSRLGCSKIRKYDLRIISATNKDLRSDVKDGIFREDLYFRIFSVEISIPPLRERREDIVPLAYLFLHKTCQRFQKKIPGFSPEVLRRFEDFPWPGNVRQLLSEVERQVALTPEGEIISSQSHSEDLRNWEELNKLSTITMGSRLTMVEKVKRLEIQCINDALENANGVKKKAAGILGITRQGLFKKMKRYTI